jgi:hypothetical protein
MEPLLEQLKAVKQQLKDRDKEYESLAENFRSYQNRVKTLIAELNFL